MPNPALKSPTLAELDNLDAINGDQLLKEVSAFIGRYLQCSEQQRTVLALWALHTYCLPAAQVTPYLAIRSAEKQSGKSLCLRLLSLLCNHPALTASFTANSLTRRIDDAIPTVLLDECQAILGTRNRGKGPALRAILASGFECGVGYTDATHERNTFAPKAFAGMGQLPESLADRSISIILTPLKSPGESPKLRVEDRLPLVSPGAKSQEPKAAIFPNNGAACNTVTVLNTTVKSNAADLRAASAATEPKKSESERKLAGGLERSDKTCNVQRFNLRQAEAEAEPLKQLLDGWTADNLPTLEAMPSYPREDFPPGLSPRQQDMIEPLLQLADFIGVEWPASIREALAHLFEEESSFELQESLQLLTDIRDCFAHHNFPKRLSTATLLDWMHTRPARSWDVDGSITGRRFARLLSPFEIHPRLQRIGKDNPARGYQLEDFVEHWKTHFNFEIPSVLTPAEIFQKFQDAALEAAGSPKAKSQEPKAAVSSNNGAGCNTVTDSGNGSIPATKNTTPTAKIDRETTNPAGEFEQDESEEAFATFIPPSMTQREELGTHYAAASSE